ncbi:hypothetical protein LINGRAHAP2_LOCUS32982 [Linum grandiflorum]
MSSWSIPLRFSLRDGAEVEMLRLLSLLRSLPIDLITAGPASLTWPFEASGAFTVSSMAKELIRRNFHGVADFPADVVWCHLVPSKIMGLLWQVWHGNVLTVDNLIRQGF